MKLLKKLKNLLISERIVPGNLDLEHNKVPITGLPDGLKVMGYLDLQDTRIKLLPKGLSVGGDLNLQNTYIISLPAGLKVGGNLKLAKTYIMMLPAGLSVGGRIYPEKFQEMYNKMKK